MLPFVKSKLDRYFVCSFAMFFFFLFGAIAKLCILTKTLPFFERMMSHTSFLRSKCLLMIHKYYRFIKYECLIYIDYNYWLSESHF